MAPVASAREHLVATLRREVARLENSRPPEDDRPISTGSPALDRLLPAGGLRRGMLVEYLAAAPGSGAGTLALAAAREACRGGRALVVMNQPVDPACRAGSRTGGQSLDSGPARQAGPTYFYPLAAAAWGVDLTQLLVLRPANRADALWALDQALRCPGVGAVWSQWDRIDVHDFRRLQLAAECGGTLGLLVRPARYRGQPTWADVQWLVSPKCKVQGPRPKVRSRKVGQASGASAGPPIPVLNYGGPAAARAALSHPTWQLSVELVRCRGAARGQVVIVELDEKAGVWREARGDATDSLSVVAQLADSVRHGRPRRA